MFMLCCEISRAVIVCWDKTTVIHFALRPENPTHQGAHVLPSTLVLSLLLIIVVLLTIYCLR